jgi:hypothetical protein
LHNCGEIDLAWSVFRRSVKRFAAEKRDQRKEGPVKAMLPLLFSLFRRKRTYAWSPDLDLSDPYIAAALVPVGYS